MTLSGALALPLLTALVSAASADLDLSVRAEGRSSTLAPSGAPRVTRGSALVLPHLGAQVDTERLRLTAAYAPRFWTSDVGASPSPLVDHTLEAGLETRGDGSWRAGANGSATRGRTDPLADLLAVSASGAPGAPGQLATTTPLAYETVRAGGRGEVRLGPRTTIGAGGSWSASRGADAAAIALLPTQRVLGANASVGYLLSELDTLRLGADATRSVTAVAGGDVTSEFSTASATWRRRLSPTTDGWGGAGASLTSQQSPGAPAEIHVLPFGQLGFARAGDESRVGLDATVRLVPTVDRYTGAVRSSLEAAGGVRWPLARAVALSAAATAGARTDGETRLGTWDARVVWSVRDRLSLELGVVGRWQRERRPELPSFVEAGAVAAVTYGIGTRGR